MIASVTAIVFAVASFATLIPSAKWPSRCLPYSRGGSRYQTSATSLSRIPASETTRFSICSRLVKAPSVRSSSFESAVRTTPSERFSLFERSAQRTSRTSTPCRRSPSSWRLTRTSRGLIPSKSTLATPGIRRIGFTILSCRRS